MFNDTSGAGVIDKVQRGLNSSSGSGNTEVAKLVNMEVWYATTLWLALISGWIDPTSSRRTKNNPYGETMVRQVVPPALLVPPSSGDVPVYYDPAGGMMSDMAPSWVVANNDLDYEPKLFAGQRFWRNLPGPAGRPVRNVLRYPGYPTGPRLSEDEGMLYKNSRKSPPRPLKGMNMMGVTNNMHTPPNLQPNMHTPPNHLQQFGGVGEVPAIALFPATGPAAKLWKDMYASNQIPRMNVMLPPAEGDGISERRTNQALRLPNSQAAALPGGRIPGNSVSKSAQMKPNSKVSVPPNRMLLSGYHPHTIHRPAEEEDDTVDTPHPRLARNGNNLMAQQRTQNIFDPESRLFGINNVHQIQQENQMFPKFPPPSSISKSSSSSSSSEEMQGNDNLDGKLMPAITRSKAQTVPNQEHSGNITTLEPPFLASESGGGPLQQEDTETEVVSSSSNDITETAASVPKTHNSSPARSTNTNLRKSRKSKSKITKNSKSPDQESRNKRLLSSGQTVEYDHPHSKHHSKRSKTAAMRRKTESFEEIDTPNTQQQRRQQKMPRSLDNNMNYQNPIQNPMDDAATIDMEEEVE